ncbi:hypothetical protein HDU83_009174 [Entophlyctis luteolus]|nr:hypothetical protein HDU82_006409 [Entophlyctis luteolus]KAJ3357004.1 hypothetical protein HDU83_009174 [Entophlyctis luteolus]KAJ3394302.1 hypothetical protein HDU84_009057 [Entophlyctis sp. JEL0112]
MSDVSTALAIVLPEHLHDIVNAVRAKHDSAYPRWPPHINLIFPFIPLSEFTVAIPSLQAALQTVPPFALRLDAVGHFSQATRQATYHLKPSDSAGICAVFAAVSKALPHVATRQGKFRAHLTMGQCDKGELNGKIADLEEWLGAGITFAIHKISLLSRDPCDRRVPFRVVSTIELGQL